jgi:hypothetical protein
LELILKKEIYMEAFESETLRCRIDIFPNVSSEVFGNIIDKLRPYGKDEICI